MKKIINRMFSLNNVNRYSSFDQLCMNAQGELSEFCRIERMAKK